MSIWNDVGEEIENFTAHIRELPVLRPSDPQALRKEIESCFDLATPVPLEDLTRKVIDLLRAHTVHVTHPRYFGLFNPSVSEASIVADALAALYNPQLATWSHAPAVNELERLALRFFTRTLGFNPDATFANFTTGGLEANMSAVLVGLAHRFPGSVHHGTAALEAKPVIYLTSESHHSFLKISRMTGLGADAICEVPTTASFAFDIPALRARTEADAAAGRRPFMIVGTVGTTGGGTIDPLSGLADAAGESGAWFHVDAAWGGAASLVPRLRSALKGIERADSVTWDAHKWLSVPMGAGMFFCRHADAVRGAFDVATSYMPSGTGANTADPYATTMQWSRRAIGLKVFMSLVEHGQAGLAGQIDRQARMGDALRSKLTTGGWTVVNDTVLPLVCFTHADIRSGRCTTGEILNRLYERGKVWISEVVLGRQERVLRACITSFRTEEQDLECLMDELELARNTRADASPSSPG